MSNPNIYRIDVAAIVAELDAAQERIKELEAQIVATSEKLINHAELTITLEWIASHPRGCDGDTAADQMQAKARTAQPTLGLDTEG